MGEVIGKRNGHHRYSQLSAKPRFICHLSVPRIAERHSPPVRKNQCDAGADETGGVERDKSGAAGVFQWVGPDQAKPAEGV